MSDPTASDGTFAAVADMRVTLATVAADIRAVRDNFVAQSATLTDHEERLRRIEQNGCPSGVFGRNNLAQQGTDIETRLRGVEKRAADAEPQVRDLDSRSGDTETRLRSLERFRWSIPSVAAIAAVLSLAVAIYSAIR